jgi:uncharacterized membrane protein
MVLATTSIYIAFETGEAAGALANRTATIKANLEHHQKFADLSRSSFAMATALLGLVIFMRKQFHLHTHELTAVLPIGFVAFYGLGILWPINTAYAGERLVHEFGVNGVVAQ